MNFHKLLCAYNGGRFVGHRAFCRFILAAAAVALSVTTAYALDECSGVTGCVSVPDTATRTIPPKTNANFDLSCPQSVTPYMWNWHVLRQNPGVSSPWIDVSLVKIYKDSSDNDTGIRLRIDNTEPRRSATVLIKLGCSAQPFPYVQAGRKTSMSIRPSSKP
jgi:hypothetical protein